MTFFTQKIIFRVGKMLGKQDLIQKWLFLPTFPTLGSIARPVLGPF